MRAGILRIDGSAVPVIDAGHAIGQLVHVGACGDLPAGVEQLPDHVGVAVAGGASARAALPPQVGWPAMSMQSLMATVGPLPPR
jgi:hypothetical protein